MDDLLGDISVDVDKDYKSEPSQADGNTLVRLREMFLISCCIDLLIKGFDSNPSWDNLKKLYKILQIRRQYFEVKEDAVNLYIPVSELKRYPVEVGFIREQIVRVAKVICTARSKSLAVFILTDEQYNERFKKYE